MAIGGVASRDRLVDRLPHRGIGMMGFIGDHQTNNRKFFDMADEGGDRGDE
jgi:hypothetical protein